MIPDILDNIDSSTAETNATIMSDLRRITECCTYLVTNIKAAQIRNAEISHLSFCHRSEDDCVVHDVY